VGTFALLVMDNLAHGGAPEGVVENVVVVQHGLSFSVPIGGHK
jgi:hypothetical protein